MFFLCFFVHLFFALKTRKAVLEAILIISTYDLVMRAVRILLRTSATRTSIFSIGIFSWLLCGLNVFVIAQYLVTIFFSISATLIRWAAIDSGSRIPQFEHFGIYF